jgi:hypothetical protein
MPIKGAVTTAALMNLPSAPMTGNRFQIEKTTYMAAKQAVKAIFLVDGDCDSEIIGML